MQACGKLYWLYVSDSEDSSKSPNLSCGLTQCGWSTAEIGEVARETWLRVYGRAWGRQSL